MYRALVINYHPKLKSTININARARVNNAKAHYMTTPGLDRENEVIIIKTSLLLYYWQLNRKKNPSNIPRKPEKKR